MGTPSYLVVGGGCVGASTAFALKQAEPGAAVTLVDRTRFPCPLAAAHDVNKIVRSEYEDPMYMTLALEAIREWKSNPLLKPFFHQTGILYAGGADGIGQAIIDAYERLLGKGNSLASLLGPEDMKARFGGVYRDADWAGVTDCTWNPEAGWGDAANALDAVIHAAIACGVKHITATVARVDLDRDGRCAGVTTNDGRRLSADKVVLCTGATTAWLLADSFPGRPDLQVGERMVAAASVMCTFRIPEDQRPKLSSAPIIVHPLGKYPAECIPFTAHGLLKCTHERSFTHNVLHTASEQEISTPPKRRSQQTWSQDVPQGLKDEISEVREKLFGKWIDGMEPVDYRMCWDAITPTQDWIISPHPRAPGLYVATGGSFHAWKFLPNIGRYVVQMLKGELREDYARRWSWDRAGDGGGNCESYIPARDLKDIHGYN